MCMMSAVIDRFQPFIPPGPYEFVPQWPYNPAPAPSGAQDWKDLLATLSEALAAAKVIDAATGEPDCVDPEKAKLLERVAELEARLSTRYTRYVIKDQNWYLREPEHQTWTLVQKYAFRFDSREAALGARDALTCYVVDCPRVVRLITK